MRPRKQVAIHFARNFAAALLSNAECFHQQEGTTLTDEEMSLVEQEMQRIASSIEKSINSAHFAKALESQ